MTHKKRLSYPYIAIQVNEPISDGLAQAKHDGSNLVTFFRGLSQLLRDSWEPRRAQRS